jgi:hypothetical protein
MDHFEQKFAKLLQISLSNPDPYRNIYKKIRGNFREKLQYFVIFNGLLRVPVLIRQHIFSTARRTRIPY